MYVPAHFCKQDPAELHEFVNQHPFGVLVSQVDGAPFATHLPFILDRKQGPHGALYSHLARANPHAQITTDETVLVIFNGPHAYISPSWYEAENVVPTWNYMAVHAYGRVKWIEDHESLLELLQQSTRTFEKSGPEAWSLNPDATFIQRLLGQITGLKIEIERLEGKFKLSQNHPVERRRKVINALETRADDDSREIASRMRQILRGVETTDG